MSEGRYILRAASETPVVGVARAVAVLVLVAVLPALTMLACTSTQVAARDIGPEGGEIAGSAGGARFVVPPGAVGGSVRIELSNAAEPPPPPSGTTRLADAVDIVSSGPVPGGRLVVPIDRERLAPRQDFFLAVFSERLGIWIPLKTTTNENTSIAEAVAPHLSRFAVFGYDVGDAVQGAGRVGDAVSGFAHDAWGGVDRFVDGVGQGLTNWWEGSELKQPDCASPVSGWTVDSDAVEVTGCVVPENGLATRFGNTYRTPLSVRGLEVVGFGDVPGDFELNLTDLIMRGLNSASGLSYVAPRGTTSARIPEAQQGEGTSIPVKAEVNQLGTAIHTVFGLLGFLPGKKEATTAVNRSVVVALRTQIREGASLTEVVAAIRTEVTRTATRPEWLTTVNTVFESVNCVVTELEGSLKVSQSRDPKKMAEEIVAIAKDCTGQTLELADSAMKDVWSRVSASLNFVQSTRLVGDAVKIVATHYAGAFDIAIAREGSATLGPGPNPTSFTRGFGEARPAVIDLGGASSTGLVEGIIWASWGGTTATGTGTAAYIGPGEISASARRMPATIVATDLGDCAGKRVYRQVGWYFPSQGDTRPRLIDACGD